MNKKWWIIASLSLAIAFGLFAPQWNAEQAEGSPPEATYQFAQLGLDSDKALRDMEETFENIVGIVHFEIKPEQDSVIVTFNEETMKAEWIAKALEARGYSPKKYVKIKTRER